MNNILTLPKLAELLSKSLDIDTQESQAFILDFTSVVAEALSADGIVKIKGIGTFIRDVSNGKVKVIYSPEKEISDAINMPFSFFEPVELADNVSVDMLEGKEVLDDDETAQEPAAFEQVTQTEVSEDITPTDEVEDVAESIGAADQPQTMTDEGIMPEQESSATEQETEEIPASEFEKTPLPEIEIEDTPEIENAPETPQEQDLTVQQEISETSVETTTIAEEETEGPVEKSEIPIEESVISVETPTIDEEDTEVPVEEPITSDEGTEMPAEDTAKTDEEIPEAVVVEGNKLAEIEPEDDTTDETASEQEYYESEDIEETAQRSFPWFWVAMFFVLGMLVGFAVGYFCHDQIAARVYNQALLPVEDGELIQDAKDNGPEQNVPEASIDLNDSEEGLLQQENSIETAEPTEQQNATAPQSEAVNTATAETNEESANQQDQEFKPIGTDKVEANRLLTHMAREYYGNKDYWVYIYLENQAKIKNPNNVRAGTTVVIPAKKKYDVSDDEEKNLANARQIARQLFNKYGT